MLFRHITRHTIRQRLPLLASLPLAMSLALAGIIEGPIQLRKLLLVGNHLEERRKTLQRLLATAKELDAARAELVALGYEGHLVRPEQPEGSDREGR